LYNGRVIAHCIKILGNRGLFVLPDNTKFVYKLDL
jgi:hypothetical protein